MLVKTRNYVTESAMSKKVNINDDAHIQKMVHFMSIYIWVH